MSLRARVDHTAVTGLEGPLMVVQDVAGVGWDEAVEVVMPTGGTRHGVVLEVQDDRAVVQVLEGTAGIRAGVRVRFRGEPLHIPVGEEWMGRVCDGGGAPIDGGPPVLAAERRPVAGLPINPARRDAPREPVLTGVSVIDALTTLVRGQKLPIFSVGGLPHLELATRIAANAGAAGTAFRIVFAGMGLTHADAAAVRTALEDRAAAGELAMFLNTADDPVIERIQTPRLALTVAEHLAFGVGHDVLVVMCDMTAYCDAVRQLGAARGEIPARRGYPGYLFSDLASLYERCGRIAGLPGSITEVPVLTMPAGDITHPVPDLTGYITEGQVVLSPELHALGVDPPVDALSSLSRMMRRGVGEGRTRADHGDVAAQLLALLARAREVRELAELIGADALSETERRYLTLAERFNAVLVNQPAGEVRSLDDTLDRAWRVVAELPAQELTMIPAALMSHHRAARGERARGDRS